MPALHSASIQRVLGVIGALALSALGTPTAHAAPFAVTGPCYTVPTSEDPSTEGPSSTLAFNFKGDLDGDGVPDRALYIIPNRPPGEDVLGEFHFFVMRGTCGHWVGGITDMMAEALSVGDKPVRGLRPIISGCRVSRGYEKQEWHFTGQGFQPAVDESCSARSKPGCDRTPSTERQPMPLRPNLPQASGGPVGTDSVSLLFATLKKRGFTSPATDTLTRGPLVVKKRAGDLEHADIGIEKPTTGDCPPNANTSRIACGAIGRLGEIAEALGGCRSIGSLGVMTYTECRDGLILQTIEADRPTRVVLRGGSTEPSEPACDFFPHAGTVQIVPGKSYCIWGQRITSVTPAARSVAEVGSGCTERTESQTLIRTCTGIQFFFNKAKGTLTRIEFGSGSAK